MTTEIIISATDRGKFSDREKFARFVSRGGIQVGTDVTCVVVGTFPDEPGIYDSVVGRIELGFANKNTDGSNHLVTVKSGSRVFRGPRGRRNERQFSVDTNGIGTQTMTDGVTVFVRTDAFKNKS